MYVVKLLFQNKFYKLRPGNVADKHDIGIWITHIHRYIEFLSILAWDEIGIHLIEVLEHTKPVFKVAVSQFIIYTHSGIDNNIIQAAVNTAQIDLCGAI